MEASIRLHRLGVVAVVAGGACFTVVGNPPVVSSDCRAPSPTITAIKQKIADLLAAIPSRKIRESALIESSATNPLDILVVDDGATGCGAGLDATTRGLSCQAC
ncbi:hypothetical protein Salat_0858800 [Sesamum alatum]|uniref:Uncharacterized protein n=1 Tax=Sesamum alatum TaxID=300844 RepID=A0AAE2CQP1_9LAMI|nr:hypothetical protein Salat_0858800 [Sesamum alatum]